MNEQTSVGHFVANYMLSQDSAVVAVAGWVE